MVLLASLLLCCIITCVLTSNAPPQAYRKYRHWSSGTSTSESPVTLILLKATVVTPFSSTAEVDVMSCEVSTVGPSEFGPPVYLKGIGIVCVHIN